MVVPLDCHGAVGELGCVCDWILSGSGLREREAAAVGCQRAMGQPWGCLAGRVGGCWSWQSELAQSWGTCSVFQALCVSFCASDVVCPRVTVKVGHQRAMAQPGCY